VKASVSQNKSLAWLITLMHKVRVKSVGNSFLQVSLRHYVHRLGVPHHEVRSVSFPIVAAGHEVAIVLAVDIRIGIVSLLIEDFAAAEVLAELDQTDGLLVKDVELQHTVVEAVVLADLGRRSIRLLDGGQVYVSVLATHELLVDDGELALEGVQRLSACFASGQVEFELGDDLIGHVRAIEMLRQQPNVDS